METSKMTTKKQYHPANVVYVSTMDVPSHLVNYIKSKNDLSDIIVPQCFSSDLKYYPRGSNDMFEAFPELKPNLEIFQTNKNKFTQFLCIENKRDKEYGRVVFCNMLCAYTQTNFKRTSKINYLSLAFCLNELRNWIKEQNYSNTPQIILSKNNFSGYGANLGTVENLVSDSVPRKSTIIVSK